MKRIMILLAAVAVLAMNGFGQVPAEKSAGSELVEKLEFEEIRLSIPRVGVEVERVVMDNGMVVYLYEDHSLPLFSLYSSIRCGKIFDPAGKDGLSSIVGKAMRTGGTKTISGDSLNILMEYIGGSLETSIGMERGSANLSVLSKDIDLGLKLYSDLLRNPVFPQEKIDLAVEELKNSIKRRNDNPNRVNTRYFNSIVYGDHPYGRVLEWHSVQGVARDDAVEYHKRFFVPNNIIIGVAGDFDRDEILARLTQYLGDWERSTLPLPEYPAVSVEHHPGVYQVRKDINQAYIKMGHLGITRDNPDRYAVNILNYILGSGSFTSRLISKVRSDEGLAYTVKSEYDIDRRDYGIFCAYTQTKTSTAHKAIRLMVEEIKKVRDEGVTLQEVEDARDAVINKFIFTFDRPGAIVQNLMSLEYKGLPADYYDHYLAHYRSLTLDDVNSAARKYLKPGKMAFVVVGNHDEYEKPLDDFGPITNIELTEPIPQ